MNGADSLCDTLLAHGIDVCFANPGTSEMHFVAALDRKPQMRCVLGMFEGVVTGAADGYARMADKPAATLLHLGPGLANGLANIHNARRARTPMVNIVGDHATYHLQHDAPLTSDIEGLAWPMSHWVRTTRTPDAVSHDTAEAIRVAMTPPGNIATLILPADAAWGEAAQTIVSSDRRPAAPQVDEAAIREAAAAIRSGKRTVLMLSGTALRAGALETASRISRATGVRLMAQGSNGRIERGAGRVAIERVPYVVDQALEALSGTEQMILVGAKEPVAFFAYPGKPGRLEPADCRTMELASPEHDLAHALEWLADELGVGHNVTPEVEERADMPLPSGKLDADAVGRAIGALMPENAILCDESVSSGRQFFSLSRGSAPHDYLQITGGAIGLGLPMAAGAAVACPDRKVVSMQADGSGMYTVQALWTQARENLDIVTVVFANRSYAILHGELKNVGAGAPGRNAQRMLDLDHPALDWVSLARGMGVEAERATTSEELVKALQAAMSRKGPYLIEAVI
ncbi:acetolactate synthase large subunit [Marinimicrococcus flavescens]|uniref:Acetolactate synthase large subunit n=1 Tax=Marinimicrococcus flavescens TaxID=3031815 RepID=A0AAP3UYL1_9PROT|nr:acetolactate synthase large subunit [Marinimicrococcus flavescens]